MQEAVGIKGPRCPEGAGVRGGDQAVSVAQQERWARAGALPSGKRASGRVILPFRALQFLPVFWDFFFFFFLRRRVGGWILHFHSLPIEQPGYKRGCRWLPPPRSFIQSQHTAPKFQVPWKVAVAVAGLDCGRRIPGPRHSSTICPAAAGSSAGGRFCSPAASAGSDLLRQGGTAGIW